MTIAFTARRRARTAAVAAACVALFSIDGSRREPLSAAVGAFGAAPQRTAAPSNGLEILEVRPSFFVIAGPGGDAANSGVQVGDDGVVVVDAGSAAAAPGVLDAIKRLSPKPIRYVI